VASGSSQSSSLSIPSQSQGILSRGPLAGINQQRPSRGYSQVSSIHQPTETDNQTPLFPGITNSPSKEICIACNVSCANKRVWARHQKEHCEQTIEWQCRTCSPMRTFKRQDHFIQHYDKDHGPACVASCERQQKGLCEEHLNHARADLPKKMAWGCPCCDNCFDSYEAWRIHSTDHQVENEKVVGWSLSTMVRSLLFEQPYLTDAVASLRLRWCDWNIVDWTKISDSKLQELREALERHKLPDAVQAHWDYRALQPPEALVQYAFCLGAYGHAYLHDVPIVCNNARTVEETAEQPSFGMHFTPPLGYFNPADPLAYDPEDSLTTESTPVDPYLNRDSLHHRSTATVETHHASHQGRFMQHHDQNAHASFPTLPPEEAQSLQVLGSSGSMPQDAGHDGERRRRALSKKKSVKNFFKGLSPTKSNTSHVGPSLPTSAPPVGRVLRSNWTADVPGHNRDFTGFEANETHQSLQQQPVASNRMSHLPDAWEHAPEEQHYQ
jgi:hypothetical protein